MAGRTVRLQRLKRMGQLAGVAAAALVLTLQNPAPAAAAVTPGHMINAYTRVDGAPADGLTSISYHITINKQPDAKGYFFAQAFYFKNGQVGYIGLQPRVNATEPNRAFFSVFGAGTTDSDANCNPGADGGEGTSCNIAYDYVTGRQYRLKIQQLSARVWEGIVYDTVTGATQHIGTWTVSTAAGLLKPTGVAFVEHFLPVADCDSIAPASAYFSDPQGNGSTYSGTTTSAVTLGACKAKASYSIGSTGFTSTTGG
ncbi:DUF3472 domain-containing protein [Streptomyces sp. NPDC050085]|uniref:DUF3472 domain-containing protein n=1 Tax=Streptomyces sp. NPDC050085 TaxID=3365600 RepID=UPI003793B68F